MDLWRELVERWRALAGWARAGCIAAASLLVLFITLGLALPPIVSRAVAARVSARGLTAEVGRVRLGWGRIWLIDVALSDPELPATRAHLDAVALTPSWRGRGVGVAVHGATVAVVGSEKKLSERWRSWRGAESGSPSGGGTGAQREVEFDGVALRWLRESGEALYVWGLRGRQESDGSSEFSADSVRVTGQRGGGEFRAVEASVELAGGERRVARVEAAQVALRLELGGGGSDETDQEKEESRERSAAAERRSDVGRRPGDGRGKRRGSESKGLSAMGNLGGAPSSAPAGRAGVGGASVVAKESRAKSDAGVAGSDGSWATRLAGLRTEFERRTSANFKASVVALSVETRRATESLRIGPSRFALKREAGSVAAEIVPHAGGNDAGTALTIRARAPLAGRAAELDVSGGPVSLSTLGVREGDFGLVGVREARLEAEAHLVLPFDQAPISIASKGALENARLRRAALSPAELSGIRVGWRLDAKVENGGADWAVQSAELSIGDVRLELSGELHRGVEHASAAFKASVPLSSCSALLAAVPHGAAPLLEGVRMDGTFALDGSLAYDSEKPLATRVRLEVNNQCRIAEVPAAINPNRFLNPWQREVKGPDGSPLSIESGPGTPDWTPYEGISPFMETAIVVCEDGGFFAHRGIDYRAIENSIRQNLEVGRFLRGGSTVTMQLAKNLYLSKEKTLSRKLQEAVLTQLLEQQLSKHQLMELYLNVVEFGPGIYGVRQAARYYFNEEPRALSLGQALYLGSILPAPDQAHFRPDGHVSEHWGQYLRRLMQVAHKIRRISDDELAAGLAEEIIFREPSQIATEAPVLDEPESDVSDSETP